MEERRDRPMIALTWACAVVLMAASFASSVLADRQSRTATTSGTTAYDMRVILLPEDTAVRNVMLQIDSFLPPSPDQVVRIALVYRGNEGGYTSMTDEEIRRVVTSAGRDLGIPVTDTLLAEIVPRLRAGSNPRDELRAATVSEIRAMGWAATDTLVDVLVALRIKKNDLAGLEARGILVRDEVGYYGLSPASAAVFADPALLTSARESELFNADLDARTANRNRGIVESEIRRQIRHARRETRAPAPAS